VVAVSAGRLSQLLGDLTVLRPPRYAALADRVRLLIGDGRVPLGARLPAERELAGALGLSRATVTAAYARLREDGWADARQGAGTFAVLPAGPARGAWLPAPPDDGAIDLAHAAPAAPPEVPAAFAAALLELPRHLPGHGYHPAGLPELRARIAARYTDRGLPTTPEQVVVTTGALAGVSLALSLLLGPGRPLLVEQPTYPNALDAARGFGARVLPTALDPEAPEEWPATAARALRTVRPPAAYLVPDFANPTGRLLGAADRERLAAELRRARTVAVVDEAFVELGLDAEPPAPFAAFAPGTISVGSLSKLFWGGLRIGWIRADAGVVRRLTVALARTTMAVAVVEQLAACVLLDGIEASRAAVRDRLRERRAVLLEALAERLPGWRVPTPPGGLFVWCALPSARSSALVLEAERVGVRLAAGPLFGTGHALEDRLRLPFAKEPEVLRRAVALLARADARASGVRVLPPVELPDVLTVS
jgi:DNA-binding transcriptional MocR family regulator